MFYLDEKSQNCLSHIRHTCLYFYLSMQFLKQLSYTDHDSQFITYFCVDYWVVTVGATRAFAAAGCCVGAYGVPKNSSAICAPSRRPLRNAPCTVAG
jgi:hypothetical protein